MGGFIATELVVGFPGRTARLVLVNAAVIPFSSGYLDDRSPVSSTDGVTVEESLVDENLMSWLDERQLRVWVWMVNDPLRAQELVELGVGGMITDNLALLEALQSEGDTGTPNALPAASAGVEHGHDPSGRSSRMSNESFDSGGSTMAGRELAHKCLLSHKGTADRR